MKKFILPLIIAVAVILIAFYFYRFNFNDFTDYSSNRMSAEIENSVSYENLSNVNVITTEEQLASFTTKVVDKDDNRDVNIQLTCSEINNTIVKNGEEFSFNSIAGNPTPDRGYKEAGIIVNGEIEKGYGGGNCQVSTTIYNAVRGIDGIEITERHEHGVELGYIENGKDSTVVYDSLDLKFKNNTGYDIKLYASSSETEVTVKIFKQI